MNASTRLKILFLCTGNSCRSQMAEGFVRALKADVMEAWSAGTEPHGLDPLGVKVMSEVGVDIAAGRPKHVDEFEDVRFDYVVTVCDRAAGNCPVFRGGAKVMHVPFDDPPKLAARSADPDEALAHYRRVRDEIRAFVLNLPDALG